MTGNALVDALATNSDLQAASGTNTLLGRLIRNVNQNAAAAAAASPAGGTAASGIRSNRRGRGIMSGSSGGKAGRGGFRPTGGPTKYP